MEQPFTNHLAGETSPYLLQHAHNPVEWYPWSEETLNKARKENKLLIISIGYAACHWCHVMEKESFEDPEVAAVMNDGFVSVKVDREERPDIDQVYMSASYIVTGRGGWPLNVIALPDGRPVYAGTYFHKNDWVNVLNYFSSQFKTNPGKLNAHAEEIHREVMRFDKAPAARSGVARRPEELDTLFEKWMHIIDFKEGGTNGAPKFPLPGNLEFLLQFGFQTNNRVALGAVELTLEKMAAGGIFDHIGGGFSRYSVDDHWHVPHFEKMLYDNAQLVSIYSKSFLFFRNPRYEEIVRSTLAFIERELTSPDGLFYSSLDADSEDREGEFYTWKASETDDHLGENSTIFKEYFCITEEGNWEEGRNVLHISEEDPGLKYSMSNEELLTIIRESIDILFKVRQQRISPALDNKILTGWNALMISGYIEAYKALGEQTFLQKAERAALYYKEKLDEHNQLYRLYRKSKIENRESGIQHQSAFLDDYAFLINAFLDVYRVTFEKKWLVSAEKLVDYTISHYFDPSSGFFFFTSDDDPALIDRKMELSDNVIPGSNSMMALNLFLFGRITGKEKWCTLAKSMLDKMASAVYGNPSFHANWSVLMTHVLIPPYEIAIVGSNCLDLIKEFNRHYLPHVLFYGGKTESGNEMLKGKEVNGKTMIYVCREQTCWDPLENVEEVIERIRLQGYSPQ